MTKCNYCFKEKNSRENHVECFIQFQMKLHNKSRKQVTKIFSHVLKSSRRILKGTKGGHIGVSGVRKAKNS